MRFGATLCAHQLNPFDLPPSPGTAETTFDNEDPLAERVTALLGLLEVMLCGGIPSAASALDALENHERAVLDRAFTGPTPRRASPRAPTRTAVPHP